MGVGEERVGNVLGSGELRLLVRELSADAAYVDARPAEGRPRVAEEAVLQGAAVDTGDLLVPVDSRAGVGEQHGRGGVRGDDGHVGALGAGELEVRGQAGAGQGVYAGVFGAVGVGRGGEASVAEDPAVAPVLHGDEEGQQCAPGVGEDVLVADRSSLVEAAAQDAVGDEAAESLGQDVAGQADLGGERVEADVAAGDLP